jgi:hypothetical protein
LLCISVSIKDNENEILHDISIEQELDNYLPFKKRN